MITQDELKKNGWNKFSWNGGIVIEWWKPIIGKSFEARIGIRFGEYKGNIPPITYLFLGSSYTPLLHIRNYDQLQALYSALYNPNKQSLQDFVLSFRQDSEQGGRA